LKYRVPPHPWPTYIGERRTTFAKAYGMDQKVRCYGEHVGKHIGNLGNILGTCILGNMGGSPKFQFLCQDRVPAKGGRPWFFAIGLFNVLI